MKRGLYIILLLITGCSSENANDCFQTTGQIMQYEIDVPDFTKIIVNRDVELILSEGITTKVILETGQNLYNDVDIMVIGNQLQLTDNNTCNLVREYGVTKVFVTAPNVTEIRNSSQFDVTSQGFLTYPVLMLISEDNIDTEAFAVGDFRINFNGSNLEIVSNKISSFYISGQVDNLRVNFSSGAGIFEGANLVAQNVSVFHRGSNDMIVNPIQSLTGELRSTGNLISVNQPPLVTVEQFYIGELIFD